MLVAIVAIVATGAVARSVSAASQRPAASVSWATTVDGVVVDREGHGVAGALVVARPTVGAVAGDPLAGGVVTDRNGHFRLVGLPPGDYWFISLHRGAIGSTPDMPVFDRLVVTISLGGQATRV